jgi:hypothetical protein
MPQQRNAVNTQKEGKINLALHAFQSSHFKSLQSAAAAYNVQHQRLSARLRGIALQSQIQPNCYNLTPTEEQTLVQYILYLDSRGFAPRLYEVEDIANKLLGARSRKPVSKKWTTLFVTRSHSLKTTFN